MKNGFPLELLKPKMSVLCLFSAAFLGLNDVQFIHEVGCKQVTLVDIDLEKLTETAKKYGYNFIHCDILKHLGAGGGFGRFDVIISDQWNGSQEELIHGKYFKKLRRSAKRILILSCSEKNLKGERPEGEYYLRNANYLGGIYWRVIKK